MLFLFCAAVLGGALNAVAGGGSFIGLPALIYAGIPAVSANATNAFALWPASLSSAVGYRRELASSRSWLLPLGGVSLLGGLMGAVLLIRTSDSSFLRLLPWLMLLAAATFTFGRRFHTSARPPMAEIVVLQFVISIYGGYFGGGMGVMMLAVMTIAGMKHIHVMNGLKSVLAVAINGVAVVEFIASGAIAWQPGLVMMAGAIVGGYLGAAYSRKLDQEWMRRLIIVIAWVMTLYFFVR